MSTSYNPFDDDDDEDDAKQADSSLESPYVPLSGDEMANIGILATADGNTVAAPSRVDSRRDQMRQNARKNKLKFQKHFQKASSHLHLEGEGSDVHDYRDLAPEQIVKFLWTERVYGYPYSGGSVLGNYKHYILNNHPLISIFAVNPLHPFGRVKRILVYLCLLCFTLLISYILLFTTYWPAIAFCREGCNRERITRVDGSQDDKCVGGYNDGVQYDRYHSSCQYYQPWMLSALCGAIVVPVGSLMKYLATCGCIQGKRFFRVSAIGRALAGCTNTFGWVTLGFFSLAAVAALLWTVVLCYQNDVRFDIFPTMLLSKAWSFGEWFFYTGPYFAYRYPVDKKYFYRRQRRKAVEAAGGDAISSSSRTNSSDTLSSFNSSSRSLV